MTSRKDWIDITDTHQFDVLWAFRKYECPKYMFAGEYSRQKIKESVLKTHRIKDAIEKVNSYFNLFIISFSLFLHHKYLIKQPERLFKVMTFKMTAYSRGAVSWEGRPPILCYVKAFFFSKL